MQKDLINSNYYQRFLGEAEGSSITIPYFIAIGKLVTEENIISLIDDEVQKHISKINFTEAEKSRIVKKTAEYVESRIGKNLLETKFLQLVNGKNSEDEILSIQNNQHFEGWGIK